MTRDVPPMRPCPNALAALGVPAKKWLTRIDLYHQLKAAQTYLETAPLEESSICQAAMEAGLSLHHFIRTFHELFGLTPHQFLGKRRIEVAKLKLKESDLAVTEIALEVGFKDLSAFGREFKSETTQTPRQYRKSSRA